MQSPMRMVARGEHIRMHAKAGSIHATDGRVSRRPLRRGLIKRCSAPLRSGMLAMATVLARCGAHIANRDLKIDPNAERHPETTRDGDLGAIRHESCRHESS
jgi:hypothetical protein